MKRPTEDYCISFENYKLVESLSIANPKGWSVQAILSYLQWYVHLSTSIIQIQHSFPTDFVNLKFWSLVQKPRKVLIICFLFRLTLQYHK